MYYNNLIYKNNINGPFSDLLINNNMRSGKLKKINNNTIMSQNTQNIKLINDEKKNLISVQTPNKKNLNMNLIQDSDNESNESVETAVPTNKEVKQHNMPVFSNSEFKYFTNNKKHKPIINKESDSELEESESENESDNDSDNESVQSSKSSVSVKPSKINKKELEQKKQELLIKLIALEKKGVTLTKSYSLKNSLEEIEFEYNTQKKEAEIRASVHFQEKMLMAAVTGLEFLNKKFDPINAKLDGWSESVMDNIVDYEEIFKELHEKYQQKSTMPPELRLLVTLAGSGFMFHLTNSLFKSNMPGIGDVLNSNPDIMKNIMGAMGKAMNQQHGLNSSNQQTSVSNQQVPVSNQNNLPSQVPTMPFAFPPQMPQSQGSESVNNLKTNNSDISGPSLNLSNLMNNFQNIPANPIVQQAPKYESEDIDRFSEASSTSSSSKLIQVTNIPKRKKNQKPTNGRTIKIN